MSKIDHGSFHNHMMANAKSADPEVGMGATFVMWTDRHAYTIVEILRVKSGPNKGQIRAVMAKRDKATRTDSNGMSESQRYDFTPDPDARPELFKRGKDGRYGRGKLLIGHRSEYHDYSF